MASGRDKKDRDGYTSELNINQIIKQKYKSIINKLEFSYYGKNHQKVNKISALTYGS